MVTMDIMVEAVGLLMHHQTEGLEGLTIQTSEPSLAARPPQLSITEKSQLLMAKTSQLPATEPSLLPKSAASNLQLG